MTLLHVFESHTSVFFENFANFLSLFGDEMLITAIICFIYWCINPITAYKIGTSFFVSGILAQSLKITFKIQRPWILDNRLKPSSQAIASATGYSFPSGHTQGAGALFFSIMFHHRKTWSFLVCPFIVVLVALSRMFLRVHTLYDVIFSFFITLFIAFCVEQLSNFIFKNPKNTSIFAGILLFISVLSTIYSFVVLIHANEPALIYDSIKASGAGLGFSFGLYLERNFLNFSPPVSKLSKMILFISGMLTTILLKSLLQLSLSAIHYTVYCLLGYFVMVLWILFFFPWLYKCLDRIKAKNI